MMLTTFVKPATAVVVLALAVLASPRAAQAQARAWYSFTGEVDTDFMNLANWRWAGGGTQPAGGPYANPTSAENLRTSRLGMFATPWTSQSSTASTATAVSVGRAVLDGSATAYQPYAGTGVVFTFNSAPEIVGGVQFEVINNAKVVFGSSGTLLLESNGYGTSPKQDYDSWLATGSPTTGTTKGSAMRSAIYVSSGGDVTMGGYQTVLSGANTGNGGVHANGNAKITVNGNYRIGAAAPNVASARGGGHLTLQGYHPSASFRVVGTQASPLQVEMIPASATALAPSDPGYWTNNWSAPPELKVVLDATNNSGQFSGAVTDRLKIWPTSSGTLPAQFNVEVNGYTPVVGHVFPIITATTLSDGTNTGTLAAISRGWDTDFVVGSTQFKWRQSYTDPATSLTSSGVFLEVTAAAVPEPVTVGLLAAAGGLAAVGWYRCRR